METHAQSNDLKDHFGSGTGARSYVKTMDNCTCGNNDNICSSHHQGVLRSPWKYSSTQQVCHQNSIGGISWPPRSYTCSFCKREFRSAQALGGHMNVHRRDRARLSQSSPSPDGIHFLKLSPNPNPNPRDNFVPSTLPSPHSIFPHPLSSISLLPASSSMAIDKNPITHVHKLRSAMNPHVGLDLRMAILPSSIHTDEDHVYCKRDDGEMLRSGSDNVRLDVKMGMLSEFKEELDLELRLGCP